MAIALAGCLGFSAGPGVNSASAVETRPPVRRPVDDPRAGNPDDPDFGPLYHGSDILRPDIAPRDAAARTEESRIPSKRGLSTAWLYFLQTLLWGWR